MIVPNIGGGQSGAVRHIQRGITGPGGSMDTSDTPLTSTIALSGFKNLDKMFVEVESGTWSRVQDNTTSAHITQFSLTSMTLSTPTPVMYQVIEFS